MMEQLASMPGEKRQAKSFKVDEAIYILCVSLCLLTVIQINSGRWSLSMQLTGADSKILIIHKGHLLPKQKTSLTRTAIPLL